MARKASQFAALVFSAAGAGLAAFGQGHSDAAATIAAQREAMARLGFMDGIWRGIARMVLPSGEKRTVIHTERIGPFLGGSVKVIEGRGYDEDGRIAFNALAIISYDPAKRTYAIRSYANGVVDDSAFMPSAAGFVWELAAGAATIRYTATVKGAAWREVGERIVPGNKPSRFLEINLARVGNTDWPLAGAIGPK